MPILFLTLSVPSPTWANDDTLTRKIVTLLNSNMNLPPQARPSLHVKLLTSPDQRAKLCADPVVTLSGNLSRLAGNHSVIVQCETQRRFIQINVDAVATWWQAAHALQPGQTISMDDIRAQRGSLAHLPAGLILDPQQIIGRIAMRAVRPGENLVASQFRQHWAITTGQKVLMTWMGTGFKISATGKALDNAALNGSLRIQTASGQIVTATAIADGKATVAME
ncbi:flagellar basal body P-ring formation chaperone FlgA [Kosakonia arachidis]|nr:flagellar basal body P-ring formation chaperone FlgA [Kosakonia arachidis]